MSFTAVPQSFTLLAPLRAVSLSEQEACSLRPSGHRRCASFALPSASVGMAQISATADWEPLSDTLADIFQESS